MTTETRPARGHTATILKHLGTATRGLAYVSNHLVGTSRDWYTDTKIDDILTELSALEALAKSVREQLEVRRSRLMAQKAEPAQAVAPKPAG